MLVVFCFERLVVFSFLLCLDGFRILFLLARILLLLLASGCRLFRILFVRVGRFVLRALGFVLESFCYSFLKIVMNTYTQSPVMPNALTTAAVVSIRWLMFCGVIFCFFLL